MSDYYPGFRSAPYGGPTADQITAKMPSDPRAPPNMNYLLGLKYANIGKQVEGQYQHDMASAYKAGQEGLQVEPNAEALRALQAAQGFAHRAGGQLDLERAATESAERFINPYSRGAAYDEMVRRGLLPQRPGVGAPGAAPAPPVGGVAPAPPALAPPVGGAAPAPSAPAPAPWKAPSWVTPPPLQNQRPQLPSAPLSIPNPFTPLAPTRGGAGRRSQLSPSLELPSFTPRTRLSLLDRDSTFDLGFRKGTADVKAPKAGKAGGSPKGLEAMLPALLAALQGGGAGGPTQGLKKGTANVKSKGGKADKGGDQPTGFEAILPALMAVAKAKSAAGPQASPDAMPPPGFAQGDEDAGGDPFGMGYQLGATTVPGRGSGTADTVPAMLAPHEAVLNRAAADMLGRGLIAALNAHGVKAMQMGRGAA